MDHQVQTQTGAPSAQREQPRKTDLGSSLASSGGDKTQTNAGALAKGLGWFSIGLGLAEIFAPRQLARTIGVANGNTSLLPLLGMRELASGIGILTQTQHSSVWLKSRVAGDVIDLGLLGLAFSARGSSRTRLAIATAAVAGVTALDVLSSAQTANGQTPRTITRSIAIQKPAAELYAFWRPLQNLPRIMNHLESVRALDAQRSHWVTTPIAGKRYEWDAEITEDIPNERLAWRTVPEADVVHHGRVTFEELGERRGTVVSVRLDYAPPAGKLGVGITKLLGQAPEQAIGKDLRRWKQLLETGEVPTTAGQPSGRRTVLGRVLP